MRKPDREVRRALRRLGGSKDAPICPACLKRILPGQERVTYMEREHHKKCVVYTDRRQI